jgi:hypothetical protein
VNYVLAETGNSPVSGEAAPRFQGSSAVGSRRSKSVHSKPGPNSRDRDGRTAAVESKVTSPREETGQPIEGIVMHSEPELDVRSQAASSPSLQVDGAFRTNAIAETCDVPVEMHRDDQVEDLRRQLEGKNELISALVAELEQVVDQLDRAQRSGPNRTQSGAGQTVLPPSLIDDHQQVLGGLQRVVQEWEELRAASILGRIESELSELRSLVKSGVERRETGDDDEPVATDLDSVLSRLAGGRNGTQTDDSQSGLSSMEEMRRQLFAEENGGDSRAEASTPEVDDVANVLDGIASPEPLDLDAATLDELKAACAARDAYIVRVTRCLRSRRAVSLPANWDELSDVPEERRRHIDQLASRLEEQVRLAEVEISLERARLSRERTEVDAERATMEKHLKRLGINSMDELDDVSVSTGTTADRRWMRFLGVNR